MNSSETPILIELHYLPSLEFFTRLVRGNSVVLEAQENYVKQSFRNRCYIADANGTLPLTVPVIGGRKKIQIREVRIDHNQHWKNVHLRALRSAYGRAPFFEFYFDYFGDVLQKREKYLFDFNLALLTVCLQSLGLTNSISLSETYLRETEGIFLDQRNLIAPKSDFTNRTFYQPVSYVQVFGKDFAPNLSIVDLIMNEGPNSLTVLKASAL
ncbi:MAG: WbqC family protein [Bacteroidota bacterium]